MGVVAEHLGLDGEIGGVETGTLRVPPVAIDPAAVDAHPDGRGVGDVGWFRSWASIANLDAWVAADLNIEKLARKPFAHLPVPVLGVPGWWPANDHLDFYDDASVFRVPKKQPKQHRPETSYHLNKP